MAVIGGRYELLRQIAAGGVGEVWDGWDKVLNRPVAVKVVHGNGDQARRLQAEAKAAASIDHAGVVSVHDSGRNDDMAWLVMERLPGRTLDDELKAGPMPAWRAK